MQVDFFLQQKGFMLYFDHVDSEDQPGIVDKMTL